MEPIQNPNLEEKKTRYPHARMYLALATALILAGGLFFTRHTIPVINKFADSATTTPSGTPDSDYAMPKDDPNRLNVLVLGIEGEDDSNSSVGGPLLTDSIEIFSFNKTTGKSSLISLPRDLIVNVHDNVQDKLNTVYEYGYYHTPDGLQFTKEKISEITGIYIDQAVIFDFSSFKQIVDSLGGIDVTLTQPFSETQQWGYTFSLPAGTDHLNGQAALYYARSRYTSTDFDRSRRQQQIILAIKDKLLKLNFFSDPIKVLGIINTIHNDVKTDIGIWNISDYLSLASKVKFDQMNKYIISTDNLVVQSKAADGAYILLPKGGNLQGIKQLFQDSLK